MRKSEDAEAALTAMIVEALGSTDRDRFTRAARLCRVADQLLAAVAGRVDDFQMTEIGDGEAPMLGQRVRVGRIGPDDTGDVMREAIGALQAFVVSQHQEKVAEAGHQELRALLLLPPAVRKRPAIARRIEVLEAKLNKEEDDDGRPVVHPQLPGGHLPAGEGQEGDDDRARGPDGPGAEGAQGAPALDD